MVRRAIPAVIAAIAVAFVGCGDDEGTGSTGSSLPGRTFLSETVTNNGVNGPLVAGTRIRLAFGSDGGITASAGCNTLGGDVEISDDRVLIDDLSSTEIGCDPDHHDQDAWLAGILMDDPAYSLAGDRLTLEVGSTTIELLDRRVADPDRPLEGTVWQLDGLIDGDAASSTPASSTATLHLAGGQLTVEIDGCGESSTSVDVRTSALRVTPLALDTDACDRDATTLAGAIVAVLDDVVAYRIEASSLTVMHPNGKGLTLRAVE